MRPKLALGMKRRRHAAIGVLIIAVPLSGGVVAAGRAVAQVTAAQASASADTIRVNLRSRHVAYGHDVVLSGRAPSTDAGHTFELDFATAGSSRWSTLTSTPVRGDGSFALRAPVKRSGLLRVIDASAARDASGGAAFGTTGQAASSPVERVSVAATFHLRARSRQAVGGEPIHVVGRLLPGVAGRRVSLQGRSSGHWRMLAGARTRAGGRFDITYRPTGLGRQPLRVRFAGDRLNGRASRPAGDVTVYRESVASWYYDGGTTACGFHAYYGVANRSLPCGTKVGFLHDGRVVTAVVDDRGPFVSGREWDLNQNTAAALGMGGVGTVWSSL